VVIIYERPSELKKIKKIYLIGGFGHVTISASLNSGRPALVRSLPARGEILL
jgi:hypothetical protein